MHKSLLFGPALALAAASILHEQKREPELTISLDDWASDDFGLDTYGPTHYRPDPSRQGTGGGAERARAREAREAAFRARLYASQDHPTPTGEGG